MTKESTNHLYYKNKNLQWEEIVARLIFLEFNGMEATHKIIDQHGFSCYGFTLMLDLDTELLEFQFSDLEELGRLYHKYRLIEQFAEESNYRWSASRSVPFDHPITDVVNKIKRRIDELTTEYLVEQRRLDDLQTTTCLPRCGYVSVPQQNTVETLESSPVAPSGFITPFYLAITFVAGMFADYVLLRHLA